MIDLKELERSLSPQHIIQLVTELGSDEYVEKENEIIFKTICHNADSKNVSMKLYYYKKNHKFHCYTDCGDNFNIYELFKRRYELLGIKYNFYEDIVLKISSGVEIRSLDSSLYVYHSDYDKYQDHSIEVNIETINPSLLNIFQFYPTIEWLNNGISEETMREFNIKYSAIENKIIIPHYDENGNLIGIRGRSLNDEDIELGKYMPIQIEGKIYAHPLGYNLYGLNMTKNNIRKKKMAIVCEGEKAVLQYNTMFGLNNNICVAACGSIFHQYQFNLLLKNGAEKIIIAFDKEGETWKEKEKYYNKLKNICKKYSNKCKMGFIIDGINLLNLKDSPTDKGKDTFLKLYKNVIWV